MPCSVLNMSFFNKLKVPANGITYNSGTISKRCDTQVEDFIVSDNLRGVRYILIENKNCIFILNLTFNKNLLKLQILSICLWILS